MSATDEQLETDKPSAKTIVEGVDYYFDGGFMVLTEHYLLERGYCCSNGCRHCPYGSNRSKQVDG